MTELDPKAGPALHGVRVVCLEALGPVPFATMLLADLGADVVRVDRPGPAGELTGLDPADDPRSRGHRSIGIDLKQPAGADLARELIDSADVFLEGMRPGVAERLGLGPEQMQARNPRLVYGRMTGWGQHGPLAQRAGHDINYLSMSGALYPIGPADQPPAVPLNLVADFGGGGAYLVMGVLAALFQRQLTGRGQVIDCAMVDGAASLTAMFHGMLKGGSWNPTRENNLLDGAAPFYRTYATSDGGFMAVGALEPQFYAHLLAGLELDPAAWPQHERDRWPEQSAALAEIFGSRTRAEWTTLFSNTDACVTPVLTMHEASVAPELQARNTFVEWDGLRQPGPAPKLSEFVAPAHSHRAGRFENTDAVLAELAYAPDRIAELRAARVVV
jgi:alpha-methylacyl-CoA racemase